MKKQLLSIGFLALMAFTTQAQVVVDTVSVGAGYINQKWYSLQNGEQGITQSKDNWDIAFEITGTSASVLVNTQKVNFALYKAPYNIANYATVDTTGISNWPILYNSDTTWTIGALNKGANPSNVYDLGWGVYDINTHIVSGDSCYVVKLSATSYKKIKLVNLSGGIYTFEYANINGTSSQTATVNKSNYTGKNFAYYDLTNNVAIDREPLTANWDLTFVKYTAFIPTAYPVVGVLANKGVTIAQANNVSNPSTFNNWTAYSQSANMSTIGNDWKNFDLNTNTWMITQDTLYFVKDKNNNIWKMRFTGFGGSTTGNFIFSKEKTSTVGIAYINGNLVSQVTVYPNPANNSNTTLLFSSATDVQNVSISVIDVTGKLISSELISARNGLNQQVLTTSTLNSGVYFVQLNAGSYTTTQKLIIQ